ncbi:hypothetical protein [Desulfobulbus alkaliphilus]|uniref:hypothetical protein n=1 Tax=Desulfobulbus alkaliphilus TaxID=869814 RepID=UPI001962CD61|nr:hypothetical protein [Desulfobulbus alkaliphilus]MBM9537376.1 hypothetical protein [Desulfobulbus alkaliphilus]
MGKRYNRLPTLPAQYLEIVIRYDLQISDIPQEQLGQMVNQTIKHDVEDFIMTTYEKLRLKGGQASFCLPTR